MSSCLGGARAPSATAAPVTLALLGRMGGRRVGGGQDGVGGLLMQVGAGVRPGGQRGGDGLEEAHGRVRREGGVMLRGGKGR